MKRGEIRWNTFRPPNKRRPVLLLTRDDVVDNLNEIIRLRSCYAPAVLIHNDVFQVSWDEAAALFSFSAQALALPSSSTSSQASPTRCCSRSPRPQRCNLSIDASAGFPKPPP